MALKKHIMRFSIAVSLLAGFLMMAGLASGNEITRIDVTKKPYTVMIKLNDKVPYKVVQVDRREILVAFKNVNASENLTPSSDAKPEIVDVKIAQKKNDIVSLIILTGEDVTSVGSSWKSSGNELQIKLNLKGSHTKETAKKEKQESVEKPVETPAVHEKETPAKTGENEAVVKTTEKKPEEKPAKLEPRHGGKEKKKPQEETGKNKKNTTKEEPEKKAASGKEKKENDTSLTLPGKETDETAPFQGGKKFDSRYTGTSDDLFIDLKPEACGDDKDVKKGIEYCNQKSWKKAYDIFNKLCDSTELSDKCRELATLLKAITFFKDVEKKGPKEYLSAIRLFQDLISFYPDSQYLPYAYANLGKIHLHLDSPAKAEGYFHIVLRKYKDYPGTPEIQFEQGWVYTEKKNTGLAIGILKNVIAQFPNSVFTGNAKLQLGKAYFDETDYASTVKLLEELVRTKPEMMLESPDLLQYLGNAYYHSGNMVAAQVMLTKLYNLYPDIDDRDTILTRIGDSIAENKQKDKAIKIYQLVTDKYPKTDGFVISTMRLAEYSGSNEDKANMYNMIISDFPSNPLSKLAMLRLALLQHDTGDYDTSVKTVKTLIASQAKTLKKDAVGLFLDSSNAIFKKLFEKDDYTELISRFESDRKMLDESSDPNFFYLVGMAYLKAHLYRNASDLLLKSYNRSGAKKRTPEMVYGLGVSLDESGRKDEAFGMLKNYIKLFPSGSELGDVNYRIARRLLDKKDFRQAAGYYRNAFDKSPEDGGKAEILVDLADCQKGMGDYRAAVATLSKCIEILSSQPDDAFNTLKSAYRDLGDIHMRLKEWDKAADSYTLAIKCSGKDEDTSELLFLKGESYQNNGNEEEAEKAYNAAAEKGNMLWGNMARERIRIMKLKDKLRKT